MSASPANFVWYDLMTTDTAAAESFYRDVIGWQARDAGMPHTSYTLFSVGSEMVAGLMGIPEQARARGALPSWLGHIGVEDVDAYAERVIAAGGAIHRAAEDIPGVGRFAVAADPQGAAFVLFAPSSGSARADMGTTPGTIGWRELHTDHVESAFSFYSQLFGWTVAEDMDMGPAGLYRMLASDGPMFGGMVTRSREVPAPFWLYYFNVSSVEGAIAQGREKGAQLLMGPHQIPGGQWIALFLDPQHAAFAVVGPKS